MRTVEAAGALRTTKSLLSMIFDEIEYALARDPALAPELGALTEALTQASESTVRAVDYLSARLDVTFRLNEREPE